MSLVLKLTKSPDFEALKLWIVRSGTVSEWVSSFCSPFQLSEILPTLRTVVFFLLLVSSCSLHFPNFCLSIHIPYTSLLMPTFFLICAGFSLSRNFPSVGKVLPSVSGQLTSLTSVTGRGWRSTKLRKYSSDIERIYETDSRGSSGSDLESSGTSTALPSSPKVAEPSGQLNILYSRYIQMSCL